MGDSLLQEWHFMAGSLRQGVTDYPRMPGAAPKERAGIAAGLKHHTE